VLESGEINVWNNVSKQEVVEVGDEIMSINGVLDRMSFLKELQSDGNVTLELQKPSQHTLQLDKRDNLGMTVSNQFVTKIPANGLFHKWLCDNPTVTIGPGDFVLDVNGVKNWHKMRMELMNAKSLTMTIAHYETLRERVAHAHDLTRAKRRCRRVKSVKK